VYARAPACVCARACVLFVYTHARACVRVCVLGASTAYAILRHYIRDTRCTRDTHRAGQCATALRDFYRVWHTCPIHVSAWHLTQLHTAHPTRTTAASIANKTRASPPAH